jgi:hypothetical protein
MLKPVPPKTFSVEHNLGYKYLLVGGCSFTDNRSQSADIAHNHIVTWPYYLRDLCGFDSVIDCSLPGAGNKFIHDAAISEIEYNSDIDFSNTLVVIMWSGNERDDFIASSDAVDASLQDRYVFPNGSSAIISRGLQSKSNCLLDLVNVDKIKDKNSKSLENYLQVVSLWHYLVNKGFRFVFTQFHRGSLNDEHWDLGSELQQPLREKYNHMVNKLNITLGEYAQKTNQLSMDNYHPGPQANLEWTRKHLIPFILHESQ